MKKDLLSSLLEKAGIERGRKIHLISDYSYVHETSRADANRWIEGEVKARYWNGENQKIEVYLFRFDSRKNNYSEIELIIKRLGMKIESGGFQVGTIRIRELKKRHLDHYHSVKTFPKS